MTRGAALLCCLLLSSSVVSAQQPQGAATDTTPRPAPASPESAAASSATPAPVDEELERLRAELERTLGEALKDLEVEPAELRVSASPARLESSDALVRTSLHWRVTAYLERDGGQLRLTLFTIAPGSSLLKVKAESMPASRLTVGTIALTRDLVRSSSDAAEDATARDCAPCATAARTRSSGRAVLVLNTALIGAYAGYSIQRAGGSNDARLTYPLLALGTGIGMGAGMVVADEWDITSGDAWYLSAGALWPTFSALLLTEGYETKPEDARYMVGLGAALGGVALTSTVLAQGHASEGSAALAHSGAGVGLLLGGLAEMAVKGRTGFVPETGMGFGAAAGVLLGGAAGPLGLELTPSQVLIVDLGAGLGGLTAAAAASPLVALGDASDTRNRLWLASTAAGTVAGGLVGYSLAQGSRNQAHLPDIIPFATFSPAAEGTAATTLFGVSGQW